MITHQQILEYYKQCHPNEDYTEIEMLSTKKLFKRTFGVKYKDYVLKNRQLNKKLKKNKLNKINITQRNVKQKFGLFGVYDLNRWNSFVTKRNQKLILLNVYYRETSEEQNVWYLATPDVISIREIENPNSIELKFNQRVYAYRIDYIQMKDQLINFDETFEEMIQDRILNVTPEIVKNLF